MSKSIKNKNFSDKKKPRYFSTRGDFLVRLRAFMLAGLKSPNVLLEALYGLFVIFVKILIRVLFVKIKS
jgi:hypothetical protein